MSAMPKTSMMPERSICWCPEMGIYIVTIGRKCRAYTPAELEGIIMSEETRAIQVQLLAFVQANANVRINY